MATTNAQQAGKRSVSRVPVLAGPVWVLVAVVAVVAVGMLGASLAGMSMSTASGQVASWREDLGYALSAFAVVLMVAGAVRAMRARSRGPSVLARVAGSRGREYSRALRRMRRGQQVPMQQVPPTVAAAQVAVRQGSGALLWVSIAVLMLSAAVGMELSWSLLLAAAGVLSMGSLAAIATRDARSAQQWLAAHQTTGEVATS